MVIHLTYDPLTYFHLWAGVSHTQPTGVWNEESVMSYSIEAWGVSPTEIIYDFNFFSKFGCWREHFL